ncbi:MAG: DUF2236 domain-containing protein [Catenulispora sp.]|nr:DUF2236 domain-containing protein [Catenulispora sp.]
MTYVAEMLAVGDPLADAVVAELEILGAPGRRVLDQGIADGLGRLTEPPAAVRALVRQMEEPARWATDADVADGDRATQAIPQPWDVIVFAAASMTHVYASPAVARVLAHTGELVAAGAPRRLAETGAWRSSVVLPGGLERGAPGYVATARVRLMHARVRAKALRDGWDTQRWGLPINQADLARTWLAFTVVPFRALAEVLGIELSPDEERHLYRYWRHIGRLLGVDEEVIGQIQDHADAAELREELDAVTGPPDENSRALTAALMASASEGLARVPEPAMSAQAWRDLLDATARASLGDEVADGLGIPVAAAGEFLPLIAQGLASARRIQLGNPEEAERARQRHIAIRRQRMAGSPQ